ncbi:MAG: MFS transporter, partial [Variovorax sp.]
PFFVIFGSLSDKIGRKPIIMAGCLLAIVTFFPVFKMLAEAANPDLMKAQSTAAVTVTADPATCSFQGNPVAREIDFRSSCDIAKRYLSQNSVSYENIAGAPGSKASVKIGDKVVESPTGNVVNSKFDEASVKEIAAFKKVVGDDLKVAGYPSKADPAKMNKVMMVILLFWLVLLVTMVYGPIAAMLVEMFPTRIRYTSMSLPYHIGNGWFGGLLPPISFAIVASTGNMFNGLWYPIIIAAMTLVIGTLFIRETKDVDIYAND